MVGFAGSTAVTMAVCEVCAYNVVVRQSVSITASGVNVKSAEEHLYAATSVFAANARNAVELQFVCTADSGARVNTVMDLRYAFTTGFDVSVRNAVERPSVCTGVTATNVRSARARNTAARENDPRLF